MKGTQGQVYRLSAELLGKGAFGVVYLAVEESTGKQAAIKEIEWVRDDRALLFEVGVTRPVFVTP